MTALVDPLDKQLASGARTPIRFRGHRVLEFGDPLVKFSATNMRLDSVIKRILGPLEFTWTIRHDTVWVYPNNKLIARGAPKWSNDSGFDVEILADPPGGF
ncbi:MAG: hypothetical protein ACI8W8_001592 [Rhodothermales bacterium]